VNRSPSRPPPPRASNRPLAFDLQPQDIVVQARRVSRSAFASAFRETPFLLVRVDRADDALGLGLAAAAASSGSPLVPNPDALAFATNTMSFEELSARMMAREASFSGVLLRTRLKAALHYAVPMRKRPEAGKAYTHRLCVGRARNNDIVLREASVSKFHAWFECDETGQFFLTDGRSKNNTKLNGQAIRSLHMERLTPGDTILFGKVETIFCPPEYLWDALSEG
jgi:FHA domain